MVSENLILYYIILSYTILLECGLQNVSNNKKCGPFSAWCVRTNGVRSRPLRIFLWHAKIDFSCDLVILCSRSKS